MYLILCVPAAPYSTAAWKHANWVFVFFNWSLQHTLLRRSVQGGRRIEGDLKEWRCGDLTVVAGRKPYLMSPGGGRIRAVVCHFSMRNALALSHWIAEHCSRGQAPPAEVSRKDTLVFFLSVMLCCFLEVIVYSVSAAAHGCLSFCYLTCLPSSHTVYFYECLQYLMEAKKAQQSLESTYKQLDSVSPDTEFKKIF